MNLRNFKSLSLLFLSMLFIVACSKDDGLNEVENFLDETITVMERGPLGGRHLCYEIVFPVVVNFEDDTNKEVESKQELKEAIREWKTNNPDATERPTLQFPIQVMDQEGNLIDVADHASLKELKASCPKPHGNIRRCFKPVFPVTIVLPDETTVEGVASKEEMREIWKQWKEDNPDVQGKPHIAFPFDVQLINGNVVTLDNREELKQLVRRCRN